MRENVDIRSKPFFGGIQDNIKIKAMRNLSYLLLFIGVGLFAACSGSKTVKYEHDFSDATHLIPAKSMLVAKCTPSNVLDKMDIDALVNTSFFREMSLEDPKAANIIRNLKSEAGSMGIDLDKSCFMFMRPIDDKNMIGGVTFNLSSKENFAKKMKELGEKDFTTVNNFEVLMSDEEPSAIIWNNSTAAILYAGHELSQKEANEQLNTTINEITSLNNESAVAANADFNEFLSNTSDFSTWMDMHAYYIESKMLMNQDGYVSEQDRMAMQMLESYSEYLEDWYSHTYISMENGKITMDQVQHMPKKTKKKMNQFLDEGATEDLVKYVKAGSLGGAAIALNFEGIVDEVMSMDEVKEQAGPMADMVQNMLENTLTGGVVVSLDGFTPPRNEFGDPDVAYTLILGIEDGDAIKTLLQTGGGNLQQEDGIYRMDHMMGPEMNLVITDDALVISSNREILKAAIAGGYSGNEGLKGEYANLLSSDLGGMFFDFGEDGMDFAGMFEVMARTEPGMSSFIQPIKDLNLGLMSSSFSLENSTTEFNIGSSDRSVFASIYKIIDQVYKEMPRDDFFEAFDEDYEGLEYMDIEEQEDVRRRLREKERVGVDI